MSDAADGPRVGAQFGRYQLYRLLGQGDTGEVYEARDTVTARVVALKVLSEALSRDRAFSSRLQREAAAAGRLQEPHVVPIHNWGEIEGRLYVDMRLIDGPDLGTVLEREGAMSPDKAVLIVCQVASALDAAHGYGLVHRDVKPENILITRDDFAYLTNFGIATTDEMTETRMGPLSDTFAYTAPERFASGILDHGSDIYSLACVLYECLTGSTPYPEKSFEGLVAAHLMQPMPRPSQARSGIPSVFDEVIARGMAKNSEDRYASAGDLGRAARNALGTGYGASG